jgi:hypothetical protein
LGTFAVGGLPYGVAFDGANIWVSGDPNTAELRASDGAIVGKYSNQNGTGVAFDGANIWVAVTFENSVNKM